LDNVGAGLKSSPNAKVRAANEIDEWGLSAPSGAHDSVVNL
jgi:hypothetical protein